MTIIPDLGIKKDTTSTRAETLVPLTHLVKAFAVLVRQMAILKEHLQVSCLREAARLSLPTKLKLKETSWPSRLIHEVALECINTSLLLTSAVLENCKN